MPSLDHKPSALNSHLTFNQCPMGQERNGHDNGNETPHPRLINLDNKPNQFPYHQSSHGPLTQLHSHWNGNPPPPGHHVSSNLKGRPNLTSFRFHKVKQPFLVNLDRTDLRLALFHYPLVSGVTMLGTGKGTVKPPDIVLHGPQIAPQHAFLERLGDEVILHPISEFTLVNGRQITGPTTLQPGNLISIGDAYFFRYDGPPPPSSFNGPHNQLLYQESPYSVINPRSTRTTGDVNKNGAYHPMAMTSPGESSSASSLTLESESQVCHPDQDRTDQSFTSVPSPRSSSASTEASTSDPDQTSSICTEESNTSRTKFRDGLESEHFVNKVARFELLSHTQPPLVSPTLLNGNGILSRTIPPTTNGGYLNNNNNNHSEALYAESSKKKMLSKPNPNFNRSDQGFEGGMNMYISQDDSSFSSSSVSSPDRNQSKSLSSYRRPGVTFYEDGCITSPSPASENESLVVTSSIPSPQDSLNSSISNSNYRSPNNHFSNGRNNFIPSSYQFNHFNNNNNPSPPSHHRFGIRNGNNGNHCNEAEIACETLLQIKRKQAEEARVAEEMVRKQQEHLDLDEILAMCEEYEEQIAKEIEEKRKNSCSTLSSPSPSLSLNSKNNVENEPPPLGANYNRVQFQVQSNLKSGQNMDIDMDVQVDGDTPKSPTSPSSYNNYGRIKTNGSLPRDLSKNASFSSNRSNVSFVDQDSSLFTFNASDNKKPLLSTSSLNGGSHVHHNGISDDILLPRKQTQFPSIYRNGYGSSPYENMYANENHHNSQTQYPPLQVQSPPRLGIRATSGRCLTENVNNNNNGYHHCNFPILERNPVDLTNSSKANFNNHNQPHPKSNGTALEKVELSIPIQKSVSFANSVKEFGIDQNENKTEVVKKTGGDVPDSNKPINRTIIATEVQVHNVEQQEGKNEECNINKDTEHINQPIEPNPPSICISKCVDDVKTHETVNKSWEDSKYHVSQNQSLMSQKEAQEEEEEPSKPDKDVCDNVKSPSNCVEQDQVTQLRKGVREVEEQELEAIREMEIERALLTVEEKSLENQVSLDNEELVELKDRLGQIDESNRRWKADGLERIAELKTKLMSSEKELQRLERMHEEFCGSTDEETVLLERLKFQHELVESDRKAFEDAEFYQMEEEINRETQRDELCKLIAEKGRKLLTRQFQLERVRSQNRISFGSCTKEIQSMERKRQELLKQLRQVTESSCPSSGDTLRIPGSPGAEHVSDYDDTANTELDEKLRSLRLYSSSSADELHIERIKSRSPIDPQMGRGMGPKTCETLREIERNREYLLNEQGVQMLEEERARVRELQKRVQDAVREEWEASKKGRSNSNQCHSLNSVGSEESGHTSSDTPTDSVSGDDKSGAPSVSTTDMSVIANGQATYEGCQQMRQKQREGAQNYEESRPLSSEASDACFDENSTGTVTRRDKSRAAPPNRPLTRYLPVRGDEDDFDLRAHIESSGHQLGLCPHVIVNQTSARGFLSKLGSRFHNWNKRWFVFDREKRALVYYSAKNEKKSKMRGCVHFEAIEEVYVDHLQSVKSPVPKLTFCVKTKTHNHNRVFYLLAPSAEAMRMWIDIIFTGAEGYKEFKCGS